MGSGASKLSDERKACAAIIKDTNVKKALEKLRSSEVFIDETFGGPSALYFDSRRSKQKAIEWMHPSNITTQPSLFVNGVSRLDIEQGDLGDCWFLCACAAITLKEDLVKQVIPDDNESLNKCGIYHFRFWRFGEWQDVYVDSLLPVVENEPIYAKSSERNEIWPSLIEKAYAKVNGCYEALNDGKACEGLLDLTGGLTEVCYPKEHSTHGLYNVLRLASEHGALIACNTTDEPESVKKGLIQSHAYSVTMVRKIDTTDGPQQLLRIFNPWGDIEWNGDWSDRSPKWKTVDEDTLVELEVSSSEDGEFWMHYCDFCKFFARIYICTRGPDFDLDGIVDQNKMYTFHGEWKAGVNAGGSSDDVDKYVTNPQYLFYLEPEDTNSKTCKTVEEYGVKKCYVILSLIQKFYRSNRKRNLGRKEDFINCRIYKVDGDTQQSLDAGFFNRTSHISPIIGKEDYMNTREVTCRYLLEPGHYICVPSTFDPGINASYLLRLYAWTSNFSCKKL